MITIQRAKPTAPNTIMYVGIFGCIGHSFIFVIPTTNDANGRAENNGRIIRTTMVDMYIERTCDAIDRAKVPVFRVILLI